MKPLKLRDIAAALDIEAGCIDNSCMWGPPGGMGTNGGCRCLKNRDAHEMRMEMFKLKQVAYHLLEVYNVKRIADE